VLAAASGLFSLQYELARKAEDLVHGLTLIVPDGPVGTDLITEAPNVHHGAVDAVQKEANQARALAGDIGQQLETLVLRVFQLENQANNVRGAAGLAQDIEATLVRAQEKVNSLHQRTPSLAGSHAPPELRLLLDSLQYGFSRNKSTQGIKALQHLAYEYTELQLVLERRKETGSLSVAQIPLLAEETYRQGLGVLRNALGLLQSIHSSDRGRLEAEVAELEGEIDGLREDNSQEARVRMKEETLASDRELLNTPFLERLGSTGRIPGAAGTSSISPLSPDLTMWFGGGWRLPLFYTTYDLGQVPYSPPARCRGDSCRSLECDVARCYPEVVLGPIPAGGSPFYLTRLNWGLILKL